MVFIISCSSWVFPSRSSALTALVRLSVILDFEEDGSGERCLLSNGDLDLELGQSNWIRIDFYNWENLGYLISMEWMVLIHYTSEWGADLGVIHLDLLLELSPAPDPPGRSSRLRFRSPERLLGLEETSLDLERFLRLSRSRSLALLRRTGDTERDLLRPI